MTQSSYTALEESDHGELCSVESDQSGFASVDPFGGSNASSLYKPTSTVRLDRVIPQLSNCGADHMAKYAETDLDTSVLNTEEDLSHTHTERSVLSEREIHFLFSSENSEFDLKRECVFAETEDSQSCLTASFDNSFSFASSF
ncbi:MAG TPA: hypothetical protein VFN67_38925 [Polyangiales bacterium]|nr:hypothetical protein [Polyangiales bacterium]